MSSLIPNYTDVDFLTLVDRLKTLLSNTDTFKDYDFEGANITILMELMAYVGDLNTYFTNKLAQNIHTETADIYEVVHSLVRQQGYEPSGYIAPELVMTVNINRTDELGAIYFNINDQIQIPAWFTVNTGLVNSENDPIYYCTTEPFTYTVTQDDVVNEVVSFDIRLKQGVPLQEPLEYTGKDVVSGQIILPFSKWDQGVYPYEGSIQSIMVVVNGNVWQRVSDFYDEISGLEQADEVYMLSYDKYGRYVLKFAETRRVPSIDDEIVVYMVKTMGIEGAVGRKTFDTVNKIGEKPISSIILGEVEVPFLRNISQNGLVLPRTLYNVVNTSPSTPGANPQTIEDLKVAGAAAGHSQHRNVTRYDYIGNIEARDDVSRANVWGEQEQNPNVLNTTKYNRAYISVIPYDWYMDSDNSVVREEVDVTGEFVDNLSDKKLKFPVSYNTQWTANILRYLEPRKMLSIWEEFVLPEIVYFRVDFGLKVKRTYDWHKVKEDIKNKTIYYFDINNRRFGEIIDFREIYNYIMDLSKTSETNDFSQIRGVNSLVIRDVMVYRQSTSVNPITDQEHCSILGGSWTTSCSIQPNSMYVYNDNVIGYYPHYINTGYTSVDNDIVYNILTPIQLGFNQFPVLASDFCRFVNEG